MSKPVVGRSVPTNPQTPPDHFEVLPPEGRGRGEGHQAISHLLAYLMDNIIKVPGLQKRIGINPLLDLIPFGPGDALATIAQVVTILEGARRGVPKIILARMGTNILLNGLVGIIPGVGEAFSWWFRPSSRNYQLLLKHAPQDGTTPQVRRHSSGDYLFVFGLLAIVLVVMGVFIALGFWLLTALWHFLWHH